MHADMAEDADRLATAAAERLRTGDRDGARHLYRCLLTLHPADWRALQGVGIVAYGAGQPEEALGTLARARIAQPDQPNPLSNLAVVLGSAGRHEAALRHLQDAVAAVPDRAELHYNLGNALERLHRFEEATAAFRRALHLRPGHVEAGWNLGLILLRLGRYSEGWPYYEWRWLRPGMPVERRTIPAWTGERFDGRTLLLYSEQGLGDALQFIRFLPLVQRRGTDIVVECQPELISLLAAQPGAPRIVPRRAPAPQAALQASIASLPTIFGTTLDSLPAAPPYLHAPDGPSPPLPEHGLRVGVVWASSSTDRSCPLPLLASLATVPGVAAVSLQKGPAAAELGGGGVPLPILDMAPHIEDMADTARIVAKLDLVITVDTSVAHLAGALGRPTWLLLPHLADWRWLVEREDSPWYPTMRLFRQWTPGAWNEVVDRVRAALERQTACPPTGTAEPRSP